MTQDGPGAGAPQHFPRCSADGQLGSQLARPLGTTPQRPAVSPRSPGPLVLGRWAALALAFSPATSQFSKRAEKPLLLGEEEAGAAQKHFWAPPHRPFPHPPPGSTPGMTTLGVGAAEASGLTCGFEASPA